MSTALLESLLADAAQAENGCWEWQMSLNRGYARSARGNGKNGSSYYVHRKVWELMVADIPQGLSLDHLCCNKKCVNPYHLDPVTHRVNVLRGPGPTSANARRTSCGTCGADYAMRTDGRRFCRSCAARHNREYRKRQNGDPL